MSAQEVHDDGTIRIPTVSSLPSHETAVSSRETATGGRATSSRGSRHLSVSGTGEDACDPVDSLGSSPSGGSSAENWFNNRNSNVQNSHRAGFFDNDPPYYVGRKYRCRPRLPGYGTDVAPEERTIAGGNVTDGRLSVQSVNGDGSEEFRSVIDDLTIENKELKRKLRRLESLYCPHLEEDKLFEVKMHGLPLNKKRELEGLLRGFATDFKQSSDECNRHLMSQESPEKVSSNDPSPISDTQPRDSGYASLSTSGRNSAIADLPRSHVKSSTPTEAKDRELPTNSDGTVGGMHVRRIPLVSERAKMRPVVRRLEQLFTGRKAAGTGHGQLLQQQLVSQSAERVDEGLGKTLEEGQREACIDLADAGALTEPGSEYQDELWSLAAPRFEDPLTDRQSNLNAISYTDKVQEQRPTRLLDLDMNRARYPAETIDYIRHLGVCSPGEHLDARNQQDEGWVYLNVLMNMAQLHTVNATPEFVRRAVTNLSEKLELSADGRKIRWKGGDESTNSASDSGGTSSGERGGLDSPDDDESGGAGSAKRRKLTRGPYGRAGGDSRLRSEHFPMLTSKERRKSQAGPASSAGPDQQLMLRCPFKDDEFNYKPLFFHRETCDEGGVQPSDNSNPTSSQIASTPTRDAQRNGSVRALKRRRDGGPIIFFNGADFCTDLSGDGSDFPSSYSSPLPICRDAYIRYENDVLGCSRPLAVRTASGSTDFSHPLTESRATCSGKEEASDDINDRALTESVVALSNFKISPQRFASDDERAIPPIELEASGVGGIRPSDNFAINVSFTVAGNGSPCLESHPSSSRVHSIVNRILETPAAKLRSHSIGAHPKLAEEKFDPPIRYDVISATRVNLSPFQLPPPTYFLDTSSSSDCCSSDSMERGSLATKSPSQSPRNQHPLPEAARSYANGLVLPEVSLSINFTPPQHIIDAEAIARTMGELEGNFKNEIGAESLVTMADGSDGSGYESGDDDMS
ncbi:hypothetical protein FGG08_003234 [Glutinoglossum americanum]|uniref:Frequency clock protein n=1 Tax=Glutinoglossum americanum TaxID=1670608 RepID=A0A9P8L3V2_9PEZI|nr:hypothetical protein FGG08_003234 [Glutinoglossum americanum]